MPDHLLRRGGVFYYHRRVPLTAVGVVGKTIIVFSLRTRDPKTAKKKRDVEDVRWNAEFETAEASTSTVSLDVVPTARTGLIQLVRDYVERADERSRSLLLADPPKSMAEKEEIKIDAEIERQIVKDIDDPNGAAWVYSVAKKLSGNSAGEISDIFGEIVRRGLLELKNRQISRLDDDFSRPFFDVLFAPQAKDDLPTFGQIADQFIAITDESAKANGNNEKWVDKQRANVALLKEIVGQGTSINDVDFDACLRVRTALAGIPANRSKVYRSKSLTYAIEQARLDGKALLSSVTQDQYLATFRAILELASKKRLIGANPASDLKPLRRDTVSAADKRLPLTALQLTQIFEGSFYKACAQKASPPYSYDQAGWRFWMPLLGLFMGMRPNEICQLAASDIK
jgi:hypothetical protein